MVKSVTLRGDENIGKPTLPVFPQLVRESGKGGVRSQG